MPKKKPKDPKQKPQHQRFKELARALEPHGPSDKLEIVFKKIVPPKRPTKRAAQGNA